MALIIIIIKYDYDDIFIYFILIINYHYIKLIDLAYVFLYSSAYPVDKNYFNKITVKLFQFIYARSTREAY